MAELTKKDLEEVLDKKLDEKLPRYQTAIIEAVDVKFINLGVRLDARFTRIEEDISELKIATNKLLVTLDNFLKRLTDWEQEFNILKYEVDLIKTTLKEKLNLDIRR